MDTNISNFSRKGRLQKGRLKDSVPRETLEAPTGAEVTLKLYGEMMCKNKTKMVTIRKRK